MPANARPSTGAIVAGFGLAILALLLWVPALATLADLAGSDPAGNALAQAYAVFALIILWVLLAIVTLIAGIGGSIGWPLALAALILMPASGFAAMTAFDLLARPEVSPFLWPIVVPALVPPLVIAFAIWALLPPLRSAIPAAIAGGIVWCMILIVCIAVMPMQRMRYAADQQTEAAQAKYDADFARLPADAPLWALTPFLATPDETRQNAVLDRIHHLDRRQSDAEVMLERGDFPLLYLARFDLSPTPALCDKARGLLRQRVAPLVLQTANSRPYAVIAGEVEGAVAAMSWLIDYDCSCDAELQAWESMAEAYRDPNFDVVRLRELRDPKNLGRALREGPERFSMLTPKAHLKAWLKFADDKSLRDEALAGARKLDHRTADAIELLQSDEFAARAVLENLPALDLEPTPPLCTAALRSLDRQFAKIYRPRADDPRSYTELLGRLGGDEQLQALIWLAAHGCDAEAELGKAEALVRAYQDSPQRAQMLSTLAALHGKR